MDNRRKRRRSASVTLGVTIALATALSGCGQEEEYQYGAVCADRETQQRVEDEQCDDDGVRSGRHGWYFFPVGVLAPPIGGRVGRGSFSAPPRNAPAYRGGIPAGGGAVSRGGFGGRSVSVGG